MSDVYGSTCKKLVGVKDKKITFSIWKIVTQLYQSSSINSAEIMRFLEGSPSPQKLLVDLDKFRLENVEKNNSTLKYAKSILRES